MIEIEFTITELNYAGLGRLNAQLDRMRSRKEITEWRAGRLSNEARTYQVQLSVDADDASTAGKLADRIVRYLSKMNGNTPAWCHLPPG